MVKTTNITKYCSLPPYTVAGGHDIITNSFYAITAPHGLTIKVENTSPESAFFKTYCQKCEFYRTQNDIVDEIKAKGVVPTPPRIMGYCEQNSVCNGSVDMQEYCMAGNKPLSGLLDLKVELPYLMWVWSYKAKGKTVWRLYALENYNQDSTELTLYPFLFPNVYSNPAGAICWRKSNGINKTPKDLLEAYYTFFNAPFNKETTPVTVEDLQEYIQGYNPFKVSEENDKLEPQEFSIEPISNWINNPNPSSTLLFSNDPAIVKTFPAKVTKESNSVVFAQLIDTDTPSMFIVRVNGYECLKIGKLKGKTPCKLLYSLNV